MLRPQHQVRLHFRRVHIQRVKINGRVENFQSDAPHVGRVGNDVLRRRTKCAPIRVRKRAPGVVFRGQNET